MVYKHEFSSTMRTLLQRYSIKEVEDMVVCYIPGDPECLRVRVKLVEKASMYHNDRISIDFVNPRGYSTFEWSISVGRGTFPINMFVKGGYRKPRLVLELFFEDNAYEMRLRPETTYDFMMARGF